jgi:hypothetical protein
VGKHRDYTKGEVRAAVLGATSWREVAAALELSRAQTFRYMKKYGLAVEYKQQVISKPTKTRKPKSMIDQYVDALTKWNRGHIG